MEEQNIKPLRIVFIGAEHSGSDSGSLARALRRMGHLVQIHDERKYSLRFGHGVIPRIIARLFQPMAIREMGQEILRQSEYLAPDFVLVFKGTFVESWVLRELHNRGVYLTNFYPDTNYSSQSLHISECLPLYDHIFTSKTFAVEDMKTRLNVKSVEFLSHGFDPDLHRPLDLSRDDMDRLGADASFIGSWSPEKEEYLAVLAESLPDINLRIWGSTWERATASSLKAHIMGIPIVGDAYPMAIQCSKINVALLYEGVGDSISGDLTTTRTFHIPASGGFMLHKRTDELLEYYKEGEEAACFSTPAELVEKTEYYLEHDEERERIRLAGHRRCVAEYSVDNQAKRIVEHYIEHARAQRSL